MTTPGSPVGPTHESHARNEPHNASCANGADCGYVAFIDKEELASLRQRLATAEADDQGGREYHETYCQEAEKATLAAIADAAALREQLEHMAARAEQLARPPRRASGAARGRDVRRRHH